MKKDLLWFKFYPDDWLLGDITIEDYEIQGLFINLCSYYWKKSNGNGVAMGRLKARYRDVKDTSWQCLFDCDVLKLYDNDIVKIEFLDEQREEILKEKEFLSNSGKKGAAKRWGGNSNRDKDTEQEEEQEEDKDIEYLMSELNSSDELSEYENIALSFWMLSKATLEELEINSTDLDKAKVKNWVTPVRLAVQKDKRKTEEFREIFKYLQKEVPNKSGFSWKSNIRSGNSLRAKFEQILAASRSDRQENYDDLKDEIIKTMQS